MQRCPAGRCRRPRRCLVRVRVRVRVTLTLTLTLTLTRALTLALALALALTLTRQILETLEARAGGEEEHRGLVVANDSDYRRAHLRISPHISPYLLTSPRRAHLLVARAARLRGTQLVVTNHDARRYPEMLSRSQVEGDMGRYGGDMGRYVEI